MSEETETIKCPCGEESKPIPKGGVGSIGGVMGVTGFSWIPSQGGPSVWICPKCTKALKAAYTKIYELTNARYLVHPSFRREIAGDD